MKTTPAKPAISAPPARVVPTIHEAALRGVAGRVIRALETHTEAHPAALLLQLLTACGNLIGRGPHCMVEATRHALNLFVVLVGESSKVRKGTSWNHIAGLFPGIDPLWLSTRVSSGRLSATSLVKSLRDQQPPTDRRLLAISEEFAAVLAGLKRGNNHLSPLLRSANEMSPAAAGLPCAGPPLCSLLKNEGTCQRALAIAGGLLRWKVAHSSPVLA